MNNKPRQIVVSYLFNTDSGILLCRKIQLSPVERIGADGGLVCDWSKWWFDWLLSFYSNLKNVAIRYYSLQLYISPTFSRISFAFISK